MRLLAGTSGFAYKEWKGSFYPEDLPAAGMLAYYAERLPVVEINNTFYRLPRREVVAGWAAEVPPGFRFTLKASQKITHFKRLAGVEDETRFLLAGASELGERLGALLFQLPPNFKRDLDRLGAFLEAFGGAAPFAFEFRHPSWADEEVHALLRRHAAALCQADTDEAPLGELVTTADWAYLRLRRESYTDDELRSWAERLRQGSLRSAFVFFKHEDAGPGPRLARRFLELAAS